MICPGDLRGDYFIKFNCELHPDETETCDVLYSDYREYAKNGYEDESLIVKYDASNLEGDINDLMQKSLDTGVDLIFEQVKDKKVVITDEMHKKAWDEGRIILY